jgi:hypothetical protein
MMVGDVFGQKARERVRVVRDGLRDLLQMLSSTQQETLILTAPEKRAGRSKRRAS